MTHHTGRRPWPWPQETRELHRALTDLVMRYQLRDRKAIEDEGMSVSQYHALEILADVKRPLASTELARRLYLELSSTTRLVDQLVEKALAWRVADQKDGRIARVKPTPAGLGLVYAIQRDVIAGEESVLARLEPHERRRLIAVLKLLAEVLPICREPRAPTGPARRRR